jgi:hypothetical protein
MIERIGSGPRCSASASIAIVRVKHGSQMKTPAMQRVAGSWLEQKS